MAAIWEQKLRAERRIQAAVEAYVKEHPELESVVVYGLVSRLLAKMTLREMEAWLVDIGRSVNRA